jgi:hypothetical protein
MDNLLNKNTLNPNSLSIFAYNGMKLDNEVSGNGNSYTTLFRELDVRLGRWWAVDPKSELLPSESSYTSMGNNPIWFTDAFGDIIKIGTIAGQNQMMTILSKTFGENAKYFSFNQNNELAFNVDGDMLFKGVESEVFEGLNQVMNSETVTNIIFERTILTDNHGGEVTSNTFDNPTKTENFIYVDPIENYEKLVEINTTVYKRGEGKTTNINFADVNDQGDPIKVGIHSEMIVDQKSSKASRLFHGIGHINYVKNSEQEKIIDFEDKARQIFKTEIKIDGFCSSPEGSVKDDESHKNKND